MIWLSRRGEQQDMKWDAICFMCADIEAYLMSYPHRMAGNRSPISRSGSIVAIVLVTSFPHNACGERKRREYAVSRHL